MAKDNDEAQEDEKMLSTRIPPAEAEALHAACKKLGMKKRAFIRFALEHYARSREQSWPPITDE